MEKHRIVRLIYPLLLVSILPLAGCIVYRGDVSYGEKGKPLPDKTVRQIERGTTTKDRLVALLGEPSQQSTLSDGTELLEYRYSVKKDCNFVMPFVIVNDDSETKQTLYAEVKDGVVTNYWTETTKR